MGWERIAYTRRELFDQVWAEPVMHVAKRIGISDVALAKVCRGMGIPLPGRGHWARKAAGNAPSKPTLGPAKSGAPLTYERQRYVGDAAEITAAAGVTAEVAGHVAASLPIAVPDVLTDPHPLKSARADHTSRVRPVPGRDRRPARWIPRLVLSEIVARPTGTSCRHASAPAGTHAARCVRHAALPLPR